MKPALCTAVRISPPDSGGDISVRFLAKLGCRYVLVGHSERRVIHNETGEVINAKVQAAYPEPTPVLCLGEGLKIRQVGTHVEHALTQLRVAVDGLSPHQASELVVDYEPCGR